APPPPQTVRAGPSTTVLGPNEVTSVVIAAGTLAQGTYQIFCARPGHATPTTGMIVTLHITP
ncbi:MAG TPA: hypothetical protein VHK00_02290, partial [Miltoncostaeaceae bacterium]|nr:hypothetical protein [Miltoncostaeaceae bacterium]